jgi:hypothetical protein
VSSGGVFEYNRPKNIAVATAVNCVTNQVTGKHLPTSMELNAVVVLGLGKIRCSCVGC